MAAKVRLIDVGGLRGEHELEFAQGKLSILQGSNSEGKSSAIQALAAVLSMPGDCDMSTFFMNEAEKLGVKTDPHGTQEGFVHVLAKRALVELDFAGKRFEYVVDARGSPEKCPGGDPRFLIAGVLSNRCKVIRQLRGQDNTEPDDFRWAVSELSLAKRYDEALDLLTTGREEAQRLHESAVKRAAEFKTLSRDRTQLEKMMVPLETEMKKLHAKFSDAEGAPTRLSNLREREKKTTDEIAHLSADIETKRRALEQERREREKKEKQLASKRAEIADIDIAALEAALERDASDVEAEASRVSSQRDSLDGVLNLFVVAEAGMERSGSKCPLCGRGKLTYDEVQRRLNELRTQKEELTSRISKLRMGIQQKRYELEKKQRERQRLQDEAQKLEGELKQMKKGRDAFLSSLEVDLEAKRKELKRLEADIEEHSSFSDEEAEKEYREKGRQYKELTEKLGAVKERFYGCVVTVGKELLSPNLAIEVTSRWLTTYDSLIEFTRNMSEGQRVRASAQFNVAIKEMLSRLGFTEFRTVMLNKEHRLYVERYDEKKKDYVFQQVRTLSTSEQMSVALILQLALKETYVPDVPFFLLDDVMENFDPARRTSVMDYLCEKAREKSMFIVATKLVEKQHGLRIMVEGV